jgi:hypothetical protein
MLNNSDAFPTNIFGLMLLINPGRVGAMENNIATAALQFCRALNKSAMELITKESGVLLTYNSIPITVSSIWIIHCRYVDFAFVDEPELQVNQEGLVSQRRSKSKWLTSTTMLTGQRSSMRQRVKCRGWLHPHSGKRSQKNSVSRHKREEPRCGSQNFPWTKHPSADNGTDNLPALYVDVVRE